MTTFISEDAMSFHNGQKFTTKDSDNDLLAANCAQSYKGAWWYSNCHLANLNGRYLGGPHSSIGDGVNWGPWTGARYSLKRTVMKIRPMTLT